MTQKFKNNTFGLLANTITGAATNITLATGHGARFPTLAAGEYFKATLVQINISTLAETAWEIVKITARSGDVLTVERAQEGTLALAWEANTRIEMRVTAETLVMLSNAGASAAISAQASATIAAAPPAINLASGNSIDCSAGEVFYKTATGNTTFSRTNVKPSGQVTNIILELTNGGNYTISWWSGIKWQQGVTPTLTSGGTDILGFYSYDGGTTWRGVMLSRDSK